MRRELRSVNTEQVLGSVVLADDGHKFEGGAGNVLQSMRTRLGDQRTAEVVMDEGWSNGYLYFGEVQP